MMRGVIVFVISNYGLSFLIAGLLIGLCAGARGHRAERLLAFYLLFAIGLHFLFNFVIHVFFQDIASRFIGWPASPFETEVGFASLGFGLVGVLAFRGSYGMRVAAVVGPAMFLLGAAAGHAYQMVTAHNFAPGNAGPVFYTDIALPVIGFILLALTRPRAA
jgi:hypothetical protein